jgi:hypothetical protein
MLLGSRTPWALAPWGYSYTVLDHCAHHDTSHTRGAWCMTLRSPREPDAAPEARGTGGSGSIGEDAVPAVGCSILVPCRLALERPGLEMKTSACCWSELSACCSAATLRMSFSRWYTLPTPSVEGSDRVSKSAAAVATFWLALVKVGCGIPSWLMAATMTLARAWALVKSMVVAHSISITALRWCSSVIWASRTTCSPANS